MPQSTDNLDLTSFKQAILNNPKELFYKTRNNSIPEQGLFVLIFIKFEHDWQNNKNIEVAINRINCLCKLFLSKAYEMQLNVTKDELVSPRNKESFDTIFTNFNKSDNFQSIKTLDKEKTDNLVKVLEQILMHFYNSALRELYRRYLEEQANKHAKRTESSTPSVDGARTPRMFKQGSFKANTTALSKYIDTITEELNAAHFKPKDFGLENFRELIEKKATFQPAQESPEKKSHAKKGARCLVM